MLLIPRFYSHRWLLDAFVLLILLFFWVHKSNLGSDYVVTASAGPVSRWWLFPEICGGADAPFQSS